MGVKLLLIKVNGVEEEIKYKTSLLQLLEQKKLDLGGIIVLYNDNVVNRSEWSIIYLQDSDIIEILRFLGGG